MPDTKAIVFGLVLGVSLSVASLVAVILSNEPASASAKAFLLGDKHRNKHRKRNNRHQHHDRHSQQPRALDDDDECQDGGRAQARELSARCGDGVASLIGNTPLFRIQSLSDATGCEIMAKAEFLNVGGSTKDRVALSIITEAEKRGLIVPHRGDTIFEGTVGSTGISLAVIAKAKGYNCHIVMPDDIAKEKYELLEKLGAVVEKVRQVPIVHKDHFVNVAKRRAAEMNARADEMDTQRRGRRFFADQFENLSNFNIHYRTTGPEIYAQTGGSLDAVVLGAGTGGTLAGITHYLKPLLPDMLAVLADPHGSGLYHKVKHGIMYSPTEAEGTRKRHQVDTVVEGVGINRLTKNFQKVADGWLDEAVKVSDREAVEMARYLVRNDGLFVGSSSAVNCVAAVRVARQLGPGHTIVTMINDHGTRHLTKFWNDEYIANAGLTPHATGLEFLDEPHPYAAASSLASSRSSSTSNLNTVSNVDQTPPPTSGIPSLLETEQAAFLALSKPPNNTASIINTLASAPSSVYAWSRTRFQKAAVNFIRNSGPIPQHVGFIMDGNRRYAKKVGARPGVGHVAGSRKLEEVRRHIRSPLTHPR
ncbi:tryptophan synthase beta subunit-like PLP-dependent enzyme [Fimicolochytrium jonesii]|uniref:tryptophan synthase beta subunit-like PLP-dependent enzyme n=1 Tax=Fimicolochytrium jonesii TaxID=1396493 RepID=UPI0022FE1139|nr:tryptophan synthase beta subunit-like PLP-dependent enzyme [Fimicolochytrium jonesii]KAI8820117.1 tryptophan synthase beta subunit-like PLP-dependent enzyme [Fimicolochytrium jonesii]